MTSFEIGKIKSSLYWANAKEHESLEDISLYINKANGSIPETVDIYQDGYEIVAKAYLPELIALIRSHS